MIVSLTIGIAVFVYCKCFRNKLKNSFVRYSSVMNANQNDQVYRQGYQHGQATVENVCSNRASETGKASAPPETPLYHNVFTKMFLRKETQEPSNIPMHDLNQSNRQ